MFLSPSGTLGMKYWVRWAPLVRVVWLEGSLTPAEVPLEKVGIAAGRPKRVGEKRRREPRVHIAGCFSQRGGWRGRGSDVQIQLVCPLACWVIPSPVLVLAELLAAPCLLAAPIQPRRAAGTHGPWALAAPLGFFTFLWVKKQR